MRFLVLLCASLALPACGTTPTETQAREGATSGALAGAVAGLVGGLISGDPIGRAAEGAAMGAAGGATLGAMSGHQTEKQLKAALGEQGYQSALALADCRHTEALAAAERGTDAPNSSHRLASLWMIALVHTDVRDYDAAQPYYEQIVREDPDIFSVEEARIESRYALREVGQMRTRYGQPPSCR